MSKKPIIVFEGIEGSGKTYHINNVVRFLKKKKIKFVKIREPGGDKNSEKIRNLILNSNSKLHPFTDLLLYLAARNENIENNIKKNYKKKVILFDRFIDSSIAYQHYGMGLNLKIIKSINNFLLGKIKINYTFLHIVSIKNMKSRLKLRKKLNKYDKFNTSFYSKVQKGFIKVSKKKTRYLIIDSNKDIETNKKLILNKIQELILKKK